VEARLGVAVVPDVAVGRELERGTLRAIPMPALEMELSLCLAWRRGERISPAAEALLDVLRSRWGRA
jgi:DNA-binding transcriptional LysR family regulator